MNQGWHQKIENNICCQYANDKAPWVCKHRKNQKFDRKEKQSTIIAGAPTNLLKPTNTKNKQEMLLST